MARFTIRGRGEGLLRVASKADVRLSTGPLGAGQTTYEEMIARVRNIADAAAALIGA